MLVASLGSELFDYYGSREGSNANPLCGKYIAAWHILNGVARNVTLMVVDRCNTGEPSASKRDDHKCKATDLDVLFGVRNYLTDNGSADRLDVSWTWV